MQGVQVAGFGGFSTNWHWQEYETQLRQFSLQGWGKVPDLRNQVPLEEEL